jgi:type III secretion protein U
MSSSESKTKQATPKKLRKSRSEGNVPQGKKFVTLTTLSCLLGALMVLLGPIQSAFTRYFETVLSLIGQPVLKVWPAAEHDLWSTLGVAVGPFALVAVSAVVIGSISYHRGIPFAIKPIIPDFKRLNPAEGFKRMFGRRSWVETSVGMVQLLIWSAIAYFLIQQEEGDIFKLFSCGVPCVDAIGLKLFRSLSIAAILLFLMFSVLEVIIQQALYAKDQKMTTSEFKREMKDNFGAPEIRKARMRLQMEDRLLSTVDRNVIGADMANMCFFYKDRAVAIRYHPEIAPVPYISVAETGEKAAELRRLLRIGGFPELESRKIVDGCVRRPVGTPVPPSVHPALVAGISQMEW